MLFSSPLFLFLFLPVVLGLYFVVGPRFRNPLLLISSLLFYTWGEGAYVLVMIGIIATNFALGQVIRGLPEGGTRRWVVALAVCLNLGLLVTFKYANFLVLQLNHGLSLVHVPAISLPPIHLPLGISFFTFHAISYVLDMSRGTLGAVSPLNFGVYMTLFPHAIAGPIVRYGDIAEQLGARVVTSEGFADGVRRFILGLAKKVLIANTVAAAADPIFNLPPRDLTTGLAWLGTLCYTLQIYFDFSGYSDMAIGLAKMFGIDFKENFDFPYTASSVTDFWRRWHISLSTWFRDYLYIPLGGNRRGAGRTYLNMMVVFLLCGFWHGASWSFAAWGAYHGALLVFERAGGTRFLDRLWGPLRHVYTLLAISVGWVLFRAGSLTQAALFLKAMIGQGAGSGLTYHTGLYVDRLLALAIVAGLVGSMPLMPLLGRARERLLRNPGARPRFAAPILALGELSILSVLFLISAMHLASGTYNPFIYFRF